jgi:hypothetical protein
VCAVAVDLEDHPKDTVRNAPRLATMKKSIGVDSIVLVREARKATRHALLSAFLAGSSRSIWKRRQALQKGAELGKRRVSKKRDA